MVAADNLVKGVFEFDGWSGPVLNIHYAHRGEWTENIPVVIVMHGMSRAAERYLDDWAPLAMQHGFLVVVPHFDAKRFPGSRAYNLGNTFDREGRPNPKSQWTWSAIEPLFDAVTEKFELTAEQYHLYGHSAGSQFVHRFLMHEPRNRVARAVAANAGWYTWPDYNIDWPYGLKGSQIKAETISQFLSLDLAIMLGDQDVETGDDSLRSTPEAMRQGPHRLARGFNYFETILRAAQITGTEAGWSLAKVEGADHDNAKMAPAAAFYLMSN